MENPKQNPSVQRNANPETNDFAQNRNFLLSLNSRDVALWEEQVVTFVLSELSGHPILGQEYRNFHKYENYPSENVYYFLLEKYGLFLHVSRTKDEHLLTPIVSRTEISFESHGLQRHFPRSDGFTENIRLYAIRDDKVRFYGRTKAFLSQGKLSQTIVVNLDTIQAIEQDFYAKIYGAADIDITIDSVIAHELTHVYYTSPNHMKIMSMDWSSIWAKNPRSIIEFLAEFSELMTDSRIVSYWLAIFIQNIQIDSDGKLKTLFSWPEAFTYTKAYESLDAVFAKKGLSLNGMIIPWSDKIGLVRHIIGHLTPEDIEFVRQDLKKLQKTIIETIEQAPVR